MQLEHQHLIAFILTVFSGLATVLGATVTFFVKRNNLKILATGLGFSAGVMIYMSLTEILKESK